MGEHETFIEEVISGMTEKLLSLEEPALAQYTSWLETATKLALNNEDELKTRVDALIETMTTPSSLFCIGFIHGYAHHGSEQMTEEAEG